MMLFMELYRNLSSLSEISFFFKQRLGMHHDADRGCTGNNIGLMGGFGTGWSSCSKDDMAVLLK